MKIIILFISVVVISIYQTSFNVAQSNTFFRCKTDSGVVKFQQQPCTNNSSTLSSWKPKIRQNLPQSFSMRISPDGAYKARGSANSIPLVFFIDTGASYVSIPQEIADKAGMVCREQIQAQTANGITTICTSIIDNLTFGTFKIQRVKAVIMPNLPKPLLGMNVLSNFHIEQSNGTMKITKRH